MKPAAFRGQDGYPRLRATRTSLLSHAAMAPRSPTQDLTGGQHQLRATMSFICARGSRPHPNADADGCRARISSGVGPVGSFEPESFADERSQTRRSRWGAPHRPNRMGISGSSRLPGFHPWRPGTGSRMCMRLPYPPLEPRSGPWQPRDSAAKNLCQTGSASTRLGFSSSGSLRFPTTQQRRLRLLPTCCARAEDVV